MDPAAPKAAARTMVTLDPMGLATTTNRFGHGWRSREDVVMRAVVVYESMYGNTRAVAEAIGDGLRTEAVDVTVVPVSAADGALANGADLLVVGGPTHAHGMTRASTRKAAVDAATKAESRLAVDPAAHGPGVREWLGSLSKLDVRAAAFDTRIHAPALLTGRASKGIARTLRRRGCRLVASPQSYLVTKDSRLEPDERGCAWRWGASLGVQLSASEAEAGRRGEQVHE
jgi:Flavodoxin